MLSYQRRRADGYRPQHDPTLRRRVIDVLVQHAGKRVNLYQQLGMWPPGHDERAAVGCHVRWFRRQILVGHRDGTYSLASDPTTRVDGDDG